MEINNGKRIPLPLRRPIKSESYAHQDPRPTSFSLAPDGTLVEEKGNVSIVASLGESRFGSPVIPEHILMEMNSMREIYPLAEVQEQTNQAFRNRWKIHPHIPIITTDGGSDAVLELLPGMVQRDTKVLIHTPQFPEIAKYAKKWLGRNAVVSVHAERLSLKDTIPLLIEKIETTNKRYMVVLCRPNSPLGDNVPLNDIRLLAKTAENYGCLLHIDEAFGDVLPVEESAVQLTQEYSNITVSGSLSKIIGLAGERAGWMATAPGIEKAFQQRAFATSGSKLVLMRYLFEHGMDPFLAEKLPLIGQAKAEVTTSLREVGIPVFDSHPFTPIFAVKGEPGIHQELKSRFKAETTDGSVFGPDMEGIIRVTVLPNPADNADLATHIYIANGLLQGKFRRHARNIA